VSANLLAVKRFLFPKNLAEGCLEALRSEGEHGDELFIALTATVDDDEVCFRRALVPEQTCHKTPEGLLVTIEGEAIFALNRDCYEHDEILAGQIHAHPDHAYHSGADDMLALVHLPGAISIVVPHFGAGPLRRRRWSVNRRGEDGAWRALGRRTKLELV
jgi:hypothetical protein